MTHVSMTPRAPMGILQQRLNHASPTHRVKMSASLNGILVIDKPVGVTSRDAVDDVQRRLPRGIKIGHTGTLDPLASGVLVLCLGQATRLAEFVQMMPKSYESQFFLGARSATDDAEGPITTTATSTVPSRSEVENALEGLVGLIEQTPPAFSAAKVAGVRAYAEARRGRSANLAPRPVRIDRIQVVGYEFPNLRVTIDCGKGTYVRSLARDLGERLGCGAYVAALRRTRVGRFTVEDASPVDSAQIAERLLPAAVALAHLPRADLTEAEVIQFRQGQRIQTATRWSGDYVAVFNQAGSLIGIAKPIDDRTLLKPDRVFHNDE
jgi:tRNA pseudouridine55 synthase